LLKNQLAIKIDQAFTKDTTRIKKPGIKRMNVERVVKVDWTHVASEGKTVRSGKMEDNGATTIKKMETRDHEELANGKEIVQGGTLSRARTV
jgi:hypothetical protein